MNMLLLWLVLRLGLVQPTNYEGYYSKQTPRNGIIRGVVVLVLWDPFQHHLLIGSAREVCVMDYQQRSVTAESGVHCVVVLLEACA